MRGEARKFSPEAGQPESAPQESMEEAKKFEQQAQRHSAEISAENEWVNVQLRTLDLSEELKAKSTELLEASGKGDFKLVEEVAAEIAFLHDRIAESTAAMEAAGKRLEEARELSEALNELTDEKIDAMVDELRPHSTEVEEALKEMYVMLEETIAEEKTKKESAKADLASISDAEIDAAVEGMKEKDEVEESLAEIRKLHEERTAEDAAKAKNEDTEWMEVDLSDLEPEDGEWAEVSDSEIIEDKADFGDEMLDKWLAEGDAGMAADKERPIGTPDKKEIDAVLEKGEISPERKAALEGELQRLKNEVYELVEGIEYRNIDGDPKYKPGLKELESTLQKMGIDMEKMAVSPLERAKAGFMGLFSRKAKKTMDEYRSRLEQFNSASENLQLTKLQLEDPKKYVATMQRRWLRTMETRMKMQARSRQRPSGGPFTMKF